MVRTQLYLDDAIHARLRELSDQQGKTVSELVREALERVYGRKRLDDRARTLTAAEGIWSDHEGLGDTDAYVRRLRKGTRRKKTLP